MAMGAVNKPADGLTPKMRSFLAAYVKCARIGLAAQAAKVNRQSHHTWMKESEAYRCAFQNAQEEIGSLVEDALVTRAVFGTKELVLHQGEPVVVKGRLLYRVDYSDSLLTLLIRKLKPEYRERLGVEHTGSLEIVERLEAARKRLIEMHSRETA
jgi:hypothetical protein